MHRLFSRASFFSCLIGVCVLCCATTGMAARFITVQVSVDDKLILEGTSADGGTEDADAVWRSLKDIHLEPTAEFLKRYPDSKEDRLELKDRSVAYGGLLHTRRLTLVRHRTEKDGDRWTVAPEHIKRFFSVLFIPRDQVPQLVDGKAKE